MAAVTEVTHSGHEGVLGGAAPESSQCGPAGHPHSLPISTLFGLSMFTGHSTVWSPWRRDVPIVPLSWLGAAHTCTVGGKCRSVSFLDCISTQHSSLFPLCGTPFISYCVQISFFCVGIPLFPVKLLIFPCLCCCLNIQCEYQESSCPHHCQVLESHRSSPKGQRRAAEGLPGLRAVLPSCWHLLESTTTSTGMVAGHFLMRNHFKLASWLRRLTGAQKINVIVFHTGECSEGWYSEGLLANWFIWESEGSFSIKTVL